MQLQQASADGQAVIRHWSRDPRNVATARGELLNTLALWGLGGISEPAILVLSELLSNSIQHAHPASAGPEIETRFLCTDGRLRIEVRDADDRRPVARAADSDSLDGRGLFLVEALSDEWNVVPRRGGGKITWAEFSASTDGSGPRGA
jgi:serine/threonine-protein kinase RsbW